MYLTRENKSPELQWFRGAFCPFFLPLPWRRLLSFLKLRPWSLPALLLRCTALDYFPALFNKPLREIRLIKSAHYDFSLIGRILLALIISLPHPPNFQHMPCIRIKHLNGNRVAGFFFSLHFLFPPIFFTAGVLLCLFPPMSFHLPYTLLLVTLFPFISLPFVSWILIHPPAYFPSLAARPRQ